MLKTCGGVRVQQPQALNKVYVPNPPEIDNHRCVRVHHKETCHHLSVRHIWS